MLKKLILSCVTIAAIVLGLASAVTTAEAHHYDYPSARFSLLFGSSGFNYVGYHGNGYYENGYYDSGYYDNGHYSGYHYFRLHVSYRCHIGTMRYHHRIHDARICNGHVTRVY